MHHCMGRGALALYKDQKREEGQALGRRQTKRGAMRRRRVAIIGGGFSGAVVAANLLTRRRAPDVVLIGQERRFGPGLAYSAKDAGHLLNVRASNMSALADQPEHFVRWLQRNGHREATTRFMPRKLYGDYVEQTLKRAPGGFGRLKRIVGTAVACRRNGEGWIISLAPGADIEADAVVFALGNTAPSPPSVFDQAGVPLLNPWDAKSLAHLPPGDVLLLGAGLTMIDVALTLAKRRKKGTIYALSRRGQTPRGHLQAPSPPPPAAFNPPVELSDALHAIRREARAGAKRGEPWQYVIDRLRARTPDLWARLTPAQQQRFLRHLRVWWDVHRHRAAPEIATQVASLRNEGRLRVLAGEVISVAPGAKHIDLTYRPRGQRDTRGLEVAGIVNCTGASLDLRGSSDPLVRQLLDENLARPPASGLGIDVDMAGKVIGADGRPVEGLYAVGPVTQGVFWECTAVPEIRVRAAALAELIAQGG